jgi:predicted dehydrogenase
MEQKKLRLGVVGLGHRAVHLMRLYNAHPLWQVVALCDKYQALTQKTAAALGQPDVKLFTSYEEMVRSVPMDALLITVDPNIQTELACDAMTRGLHVTTEVPAAYTLDQCRSLVRTVRKTGAKYQLSEQTRYWGFIQEWRRMAERGEFGKILFMEGEYLHYEENWMFWVDPETGGLFGGGKPPEGRKTVPTWRNTTFRHPIYYLPHELSPLLSIIDDRVTKVSCMGTRPVSYHTEDFPARDMEVALMHTEKDVIMRLAVGFTSPHPPRSKIHAHWYQVKGTKCTVEWARTDKEQPKMWRYEDNTWRDMNWSPEVKEASEFIKSSGHLGADWWPVDSFARAILYDEPLSMDVYKAVETAAPAILAAESCEKGGILLEVPNFREE